MVMKTSVDTFLSNLELLISLNKLSNRVLAKKSGVSDRLIGMYRNKEAIPSMDKAEKIANALGFELWQLQTPKLDPGVIKARKLEKVLYAYIETDQEGQKVMEATAEYVVSHKKEARNDKEKKNKGNAA